MKKTSLSLLCGFIAATIATAADNDNIVRRPGVNISASSHFSSFTPDKAIDGNYSDKESRWVSGNAPGQHWLALEFKAPEIFNHLSIRFWQSTHVSTDFDIQVEKDRQWQTIREIHDNNAVLVKLTFPDVESRKLRILFRKNIPDNMVRIYELTVGRLSAPVELNLSNTFSYGILKHEGNPQLGIVNHGKSRVAADIVISHTCLVNPQAEKNTVKRLNVDLQPLSTTSIPFPYPERFGYHLCEISINDMNGKSINNFKQKILYIPRNQSVRYSASPFGSHYHHFHNVLADYIGIRWWRNHDVYGRWNFYSDSKGKSDWSDLKKRLGLVAENAIRECFVLIGAPRPHSTILPGEPCESDKSSLYSYYPPSNLKAWEDSYLIPVAEMLKKSSPFRAYEVWNEAWSYYRLRGLHGTPGEAMELFRTSYQTLKKTDPDALVYATDVKPEMVESRYAFRNFGRDMFELGYLRFNDILSYHSYGLMNDRSIEQIRRNAWDFGRDMELWSTETAVEGKPYYTLMESLAVHRSSGNGKTFIYTGGKWAPLMSDDQQPTLYLAAQAALIRELDDALPIGQGRQGNSSFHLFVKNGNAIALCFTNETHAQEIPVTITGKSVITDMFGNTVSHPGKQLTRENPLFVRDPANDFIVRTIAARLSHLATRSSDPDARALASSMTGKITSATNAREIADLKQSIQKKRGSAGDAFLYDTNQVLDLLTNYQIMLARQESKTPGSGRSIKSVSESMDSLWRDITKKNENSFLVPNTERLASRAQKLLIYARMYDSDGDTITRDIFLDSAAAELAGARARLPLEDKSKAYTTKSYFRAHKRLIRSENYCFPAGKAGEAMITLANPTGKELHGRLSINMPEGWTSIHSHIDYKVPPLSRILIPMTVNAPDSPGKTGVISINDEAGQFPFISASCEILKSIPPYPVLDGPISTGTFTGN